MAVIGSIDIMELAPIPAHRREDLAVDDTILADFGSNYDRGLEVPATAHEVVDSTGEVVGYVFAVHGEDTD